MAERRGPRLRYVEVAFAGMLTCAEGSSRMAKRVSRLPGCVGGGKQPLFGGRLFVLVRNVLGHICGQTVDEG